MKDLRVYYVEWRTLLNETIKKRIFRDITYQQCLEYFLEHPEVVYLYIEDITNQPIEDFERKVVKNYEV